MGASATSPYRVVGARGRGGAGDTAASALGSHHTLCRRQEPLEVLSGLAKGKGSEAPTYITKMSLASKTSPHGI